MPGITQLYQNGRLSANLKSHKLSSKLPCFFLIPRADLHYTVPSLDQFMGPPFFYRLFKLKTYSLTIHGIQFFTYHNGASHDLSSDHMTEIIFLPPTSLLSVSYMVPLLPFFFIRHITIITRMTAHTATAAHSTTHNMIFWGSTRHHNIMWGLCEESHGYESWKYPSAITKVNNRLIVPETMLQIMHICPTKPIIVTRSIIHIWLTSWIE